MIKFQQQFNEIKLYYYFKHSSNKIPNSKRKSIQSFFTFDLRAINNRTELFFSTKSQFRSRNSIYPIYIYIHVPIIRSKTDPTSLNRRRKRISDGQRSDSKQLGQEKTPRGFPGGWKAGLERICEYLRTRVHIEFYSLFANTGRATALLCPTRRPASYVHSDCLVNK